MNKYHPYHPIIYVRGFAATQGEIEEAVADPYMGFNIGSTKARQVWTGELKKFFFESPIVRLQREHDYDDAFVAGEDLIAAMPKDPVEPQRPDITLPYQSIIIYRYYDEASEAFGTGDIPPIEHFAEGLSHLIVRLRKLVCRKGGVHPFTEKPLDNEVSEKDFRVYLVAHSMGGLICRALLQNPKIGSDDARSAVDKFFTYATPHNGIDLRIVRNVPGWASFGDVNNFNRERMAKYFDLNQSEDVSIVKNFPPERIFNLVGTNPRDYLVLRGLSSWAAGETSDGLVRIENATTHGSGPDGKDVLSPRAFVHRSHSGHYGIINSEEGYQNLTRFLFGAVRIDGILDIDDITLPREVQAEFDKGKRVLASYQFEVTVSVRGCQWQMHRRTVQEHSAIFRTFDELFPTRNGKRESDRGRSPHLFSVFLDPEKSTKKSDSVSFAFDLAVLVPDYEVDGLLFLARHYEGGYIYRELIIVEAIPDENALGGWRIKYGYQSETPNAANKPADTRGLPNGEKGIAFDIEVDQPKRPGIDATLRIEARPWS
jgi:hypothetical protein